MQCVHVRLLVTAVNVHLGGWRVFVGDHGARKTDEVDAPVVTHRPNQARKAAQSDSTERLNMRKKQNMSEWLRTTSSNKEDLS